MNLSLFKSIMLPYKRPFSFEKTFYIPSHFPSKLEYYQKDEYYIPMNFNRKIIGIKFYMKLDELWIDIFSNDGLSDDYIDNLKKEISHRFSLDKDYSAFYDKHRNDKFLSSVIERNYGKHLSSIYSLYQNLIVSTFLQNTTVKRTISMCETIMSKYGIPIKINGIDLSAFWNIEDFNPSEEELRALKVGYRAKTFLRVTKHFKETKISDEQLRQLPTPRLIKELLKIYGVGKQTVYYLVAGQFHRTEYLKHIPLWERKILSRYIFDVELKDEKEIIEWFQETYGAWCGFALSMIFEDIFYQHKQEPLPWLKLIMREK